MSLPVIKLNQGIHAIHLFYRIDRLRWAQLSPNESAQTRARLEKICADNAHVCQPNLRVYANVSGKADLSFFILAAELAQACQIHREIEACFPPGALIPVYSYFSVTELTEYMPTDEDNLKILEQEKLEPGSPQHEKRLAELKARMDEYKHYRLYPELPDWELMGFYPMSKRRQGNDNWYMLDFAARKKLMSGHARVGRKYSGRISQLITGSTGLDEWEWGVTLMAHQADALKEIVYEMRFDEVSARYGEFGPFYINIRLSPVDLWQHLHL